MPLDKVVGSHSKSPGTVQCLTIGCSDPSSFKLDRERYPVPCLKELDQSITALESVDYVSVFDGTFLLGDGNYSRVFGMQEI